MLETLLFARLLVGLRENGRPLRVCSSQKTSQIRLEKRGSKKQKPVVTSKAICRAKKPLWWIFWSHKTKKTELDMWVWVKIKPLGDRRFESMFPFTRATHFVYLFHDPRPC